jgi:hypothetical protein
LVDSENLNSDLHVENPSSEPLVGAAEVPMCCD